MQRANLFSVRAVSAVAEFLLLPRDRYSFPLAVRRSLPNIPASVRDSRGHRPEFADSGAAERGAVSFADLAGEHRRDRESAAQLPANNNRNKDLGTAPFGDRRQRRRTHRTCRTAGRQLRRTAHVTGSLLGRYSGFVEMPLA